MDWKRLAKGAGFGLAVSVGANFVGRELVRRGQTMGLYAPEVGQRVGSVVSAKFGGWQGNALFQLADAVIDRYITPRNRAFSSGTQGAVQV